MTEGLRAFHRAALWCAVFALAVAGLAIAEDSDDSEKRDTLRARGFEDFDTDGDGHLSKQERAAARAKRHERRLEEFDANGDGYLSKQEQAAARAKRNEHDLEEFDTDGDGKLSRQEQKASRQKRSHQKARELERFDADGDGKLTGEEKERAKDAYERHRKRRGRGPGDRPAVDQPGYTP